MKISVLVTSAFLGFSNLLFAQDPQFTQHFSTGIYNNPAFTGSAGKARLNAAYMNQWPKIAGNFQTSFLSFDISKEKLPFDFGIYSMYDRAGGGTLNTSQLGLSIARSFKIYKNVSLRLGFSGALVSRALDASKLTFGDQIDSRFGFVYQTSDDIPFNRRANFINLNAGLVLHSNRFLIGYSVSNLNEPNQSLSMSSSILNMRHTLQGAFRINFNDTENLSGFYLSTHYSKQKDFTSFLPGLIYRYKSVRAGLAYRNDDAYILNAAYSGKNLSIGYSYDYTVSKLTNKTGGSHEYTINWTFGKLNEKRPGIGFISSLF
jgi:type IX secretion system PorP/SprF family membrane protein